MGQLPDLQDARRRLGLALSAVRHDRWVLGYLRGGCMQPIAGSEISRKFLQSRPLMPLSRRALYEKRPMVINTVIDNPITSVGYDWELDWPAILYAPAGEMAHAIHTSRGHARALSENVAKKFESVSADRLMFPAIQLKRMTW